MSIPIPIECGTVGPLEVHGQETHAIVGEKQVLVLWSNRSKAVLRYEWTVRSAPATSRLFLAEPSGLTAEVATATCQKPYFNGSVPNFTPDLPGLYVFDVRAVEQATGQVAFGEASMW